METLRLQALAGRDRRKATLDIGDLRRAGPGAVAREAAAKEIGERIRTRIAQVCFAPKGTEDVLAIKVGWRTKWSSRTCSGPPNNTSPTRRMTPDSN
ncbi:hypothetical protein [Mesorhizobium japonicum]|uniref:hypothetical protein n=1 Tax=Mesorhizobium japonicum TaxID=2066070 RepID=UPI000315F6F0|nr:hypothetical protein [Mesorhizobium japonicum]